MRHAIFLAYLTLGLSSLSSATTTFGALNTTTNTGTVPGAGSPPSTTPTTTTPTASGPKRLAIRVAREPVVNPKNADAIFRWREGLRVRRESLQRLGEAGLLTTTEMSQMGELLRQAEQKVEDLARSGDPITVSERKGIQRTFEGLRDSTINKQFNNAFDGNMTEDKIKAMSRNQIKNHRETVQEFNEIASKLDPEDRRAVRDIQQDINDLIRRSRANNTQDSPEVRQELARLRAQFNQAVNVGEIKAERARERAAEQRRNRQNGAQNAEAGGVAAYGGSSRCHANSIASYCRRD